MSRVVVMKKTKTIERYNTASGRTCPPTTIILSLSYQRYCPLVPECPPITPNIILDGGQPDSNSLCILDGGNPFNTNGQLLDGGSP